MGDFRRAGSRWGWRKLGYTRPPETDQEWEVLRVEWELMRDDGGVKDAWRQFYFNDSWITFARYYDRESVEQAEREYYAGPWPMGLWSSARTAAAEARMSMWDGYTWGCARERTFDRFYKGTEEKT